MLTDLDGIQESDEQIRHVDISIDIESRASGGDELIERVYTFSYFEEADVWTFTKFEEERSPDTELVSDRDWSTSREVSWHSSETPTVEVPPEVRERLEEVLGADSVELQVPNKR